MLARYSPRKDRLLSICFCLALGLANPLICRAESSSDEPLEYRTRVPEERRKALFSLIENLEVLKADPGSLDGVRSWIHEEEQRSDRDLEDLSERIQQIKHTLSEIEINQERLADRKSTLQTGKFLIDQLIKAEDKRERAAAKQPDRDAEGDGLDIPLESAQQTADPQWAEDIAVIKKGVFQILQGATGEILAISEVRREEIENLEKRLKEHDAMLEVLMNELRGTKVEFESVKKETQALLALLREEFGEGEPTEKTPSVPLEPKAVEVKERKPLLEIEIEGLRTYEVQPGDTIESISDRFGVKRESIEELNNLDAGASLPVGRILKIPNKD